MQHQIIYNAIQTPDGTLLESHHRHDYKEHIDKITGELYIVDGGDAYLRRSVNKIPATELSIDTSYPFEVQREHFSWGSYGKDGKQEKHHIKLKDMTDEHIHAILETQRHIRWTYVKKLFQQEVEYRKGQIT